MVATEVGMLRVHMEEVVGMVAVICKVTNGGVTTAALIIVHL